MSEAKETNLKLNIRTTGSPKRRSRDHSLTEVSVLLRLISRTYIASPTMLANPD